MRAVRGLLNTMLRRARSRRTRATAVWIGVATIAWTATACCESAPRDEVSASGIQAVHGELFLGPSSCDSGGCSAVSGVFARVRALKAGGVVVAETVTNGDGAFMLALPPDTYAVEVAPRGSLVDRSLATVEINIDSGLAVVRTYTEEIGPELHLVFAEDVPFDRRTQIYSDNDLSVRGATEDGAWVLPPNDGHPQLEGERLLMEYPDEITEFFLDTIHCAD